MGLQGRKLPGTSDDIHSYIPLFLSFCTRLHYADSRMHSFAHQQLIPTLPPHFLYPTLPHLRKDMGQAGRRGQWADSRANTASLRRPCWWLLGKNVHGSPSPPAFPHQPCSLTPELSASSQGRALPKAACETEAALIRLPGLRAAA